MVLVFKVSYLMGIIDDFNRFFGNRVFFTEGFEKLILNLNINSIVKNEKRKISQEFTFCGVWVNRGIGVSSALG
jgi:hypothetical protein